MKYLPYVFLLSLLLTFPISSISKNLYSFVNLPINNQELSQLKKQVSSFNQSQVKSSSISNPPSPSPLPYSTLTPTQTPIPKQPTASSKLETTQPQPKYQLSPCEDDAPEGCYTMRDVPFEEMATAEELNYALNNYRQAHGLNKINIDPQICQLANQRALEVSTNFSHDGFRNHIENGDYDFTGFQSIAENLWQGSFSAVHIVEYGWDNSEGHRANLQGKFSRGCAGVYATNAVYIFVN